MAEIKILRKDETPSGWTVETAVEEGGGRTNHRVEVSRDALERYGGKSAEELVRRSFEFLLAREPKESILRSFDLPTIERYFPEYPREIRK